MDKEWESGPMSILWTKKAERLCCFFEGTQTRAL